jgi:hypothetical protein
MEATRAMIKNAYLSGLISERDRWQNGDSSIKLEEMPRIEECIDVISRIFGIEA